jgi:deoxycytidylate deaminase
VRETTLKSVGLASSQGAAVKKPRLDFSARESSELIIGLSGAVGCGMEHVTSAVIRLLEEHGYTVFHLKISRFIERLLGKGVVPDWNPDFDKRNRYEKLQLAGNRLRSLFTSDFLSELAVASISSFRVQRAKPGQAEISSITDIVPERVAYIVDQLKHPDEVLLLRKVYGNLFYLIGVLASEKQRIRNLRESIGPNEVATAIERDRRDEEEHGQQLDRTLKLSDFFLRNNYQNDESIEKPLRRFFALLHGQTSRTPTRDEYAMYVAFSAGLRSACLSRQVGAAITDKAGNVISTGCNDVPKAHGGLYSEEDSPNDHRCVHMQGGRCFNDHHKGLLSAEIEELLREEHVEPGTAKRIAEQLRTRTRLRDLLEFSRSVHAEMDALVSLVRKGGPTATGGSLYSTTFPCHNCARHIVAAGIANVFYIEPYEKSLALDLHADAIVSDPDEAESTKVRFLHFDGVAPRQYQELFFAKAPRKQDGIAVRLKLDEARKSRIQYLDSYRDLESKVVQNLVGQGFSQDEIVELSDQAAPRTSY